MIFKHFFGYFVNTMVAVVLAVVFTRLAAQWFAVAEASAIHRLKGEFRSVSGKWKYARELNHPALALARFIIIAMITLAVTAVTEYWWGAISVFALLCAVFGTTHRSLLNKLRGLSRTYTATGNFYDRVFIRLFPGNVNNDEAGEAAYTFERTVGTIAAVMFFYTTYLL